LKRFFFDLADSILKFERNLRNRSRERENQILPSHCPRIAIRFLNRDSVPRIRSPKGERKGLDSRVLKLDCENVIGDSVLLPHQLIQAMFRYDATTLPIRIHTMIFARRLAVNGHSIPHRFAIGGWTEHQMQVARMKVEDDFSAGRLEDRALFVIDPFAGQSPLV
jgi:hypothetical protein